LEQPHPSATLKNIDGLEFWEWREENVLKIQLTGQGLMRDCDAEAMTGDFVDESHYVLLAQEDCDIYKPRQPSTDELFGEVSSSASDDLLLSFRKNVIPMDIVDRSRELLRNAATRSDNRGNATGKINPNDPSTFRGVAGKYGIVPVGNGTRARYYLEDGTLSDTVIAAYSNSGVIGNFNAEARNPFCRQTSYTKAHKKDLEDSLPLFEAINDCFRKQVPTRWDSQRQFLERTGIKNNGWVLGDTVFTTVTVNRNFRTAVHTDAGDYPDGFGNLTVLGKGDYKGAYTVFPKFRVAADVRSGDFLAMDVHQLHGNVPMDPMDDEENFERVSIVCYTRVLMKNCGSVSEELEKYEKWLSTYKPPREKSLSNRHRKHEEEENDRAEAADFYSMFSED